MSSLPYHHPATPELSPGNIDLKRIDFLFKALPSVSISEVHVSNRFPEYGYAVNDECNLAVRVMKGYNVTIFIHGTKETFSLSKGTGFEIKKGTPYYLIADPSCVLYEVSEPPFSKAQQRIVTFSD